MWKITEKVLSKIYGSPKPLYINRYGVKLVISLDFTRVFIYETDEYVGWVLFNFLIFKRKVNEGVTLKGMFNESPDGYPTRYFQGVNREEVIMDIQSYVDRMKSA